jgi:uncharacterized membrane protein
MKRATVVGLVLAAAAVAGSLVVWSRVPDPMPVHWNIWGRPDGWQPRAFGLLLMPGLIVAVSVLMPLSLRLERRREHIERSAQPIAVILVTMAGVFCAFHGLMLRAVLAPSGELSGRAVLAVIAAMMLVFGNVMGKLRSNSLVGVRTPWTLASEAVWHRTHRFAGWSMTVGAVLALATCCLPPPAMFAAGLASILAGALVPVAYSYAIRERTPPARLT